MLTPASVSASAGMAIARDSRAAVFERIEKPPFGQHYTELVTSAPCSIQCAISLRTRYESAGSARSHSATGVADDAFSHTSRTSAASSSSLSDAGFTALLV